MNTDPKKQAKQENCGPDCNCKGEKKQEGCCGGKDQACVEYKEKNGECCGGTLCGNNNGSKDYQKITATENGKAHDLEQNVIGEVDEKEILGEEKHKIQEEEI